MIALVELERFLPLLRQKITGPLDVMMLEALLTAATKFCRESLLAQEQISITAPVVGDDVSLLPDDGQVKSCCVISATTPEKSKQHDVSLTVGQDYLTGYEQVGPGNRRRSTRSS